MRAPLLPPILLLPLLASAGAAQCELGPLVHPDDGPEVAAEVVTVISGGESWLFAGRPSEVDSASGLATGAVMVYRRVHGTWLHEQELFPSSAIDGARFGLSLDADGGRLIVGAPNQGSALGQGAAHVFELSAGHWSEAAKLLPSGASAGYFGRGVAIDDGFAVVGDTWGSLFPGSGVGQVEVFRFDSTSGGWMPDAVLQPDAPNDGGREFGRAVDVLAQSSTVAEVVVGAPTVGVPPEVGSFAGAAFVFGRDGSGAWSQEVRFGPTNLGDYATDVGLNQFGNVLVGAPGATVAGQLRAGAVYRIEDSGPVFGPPSWSIVETFHAPTPVTDGAFGEAVDLGNLRALVSEPASGLPGTLPTVHVIDLVGGLFGSWQHVAEFEVGDEFGTATHALAQADDEILAVPKSGTGSSTLVDRTALPDFEPASVGGDLQVDVDTIALDIGGTQCLQIDVGAGYGGLVYWILGSASGTSPGVPVDGVVVPLKVPDTSGPIDYFYYSIFAPSLGAAPLLDSLGTLDAEGTALARFQLPPGFPPALGGAVVHHAAIVLDPVQGLVVHATQPAAVRLEAQLPPELLVSSIDPFNGEFVTTGGQAETFSVSVDATTGVAPIVGYTWDFQDGSGPFTTTSPFASKLLDMGDYDVTLTAVDADGFETTIVIPIFNHAQPFAQPSIATPPPFNGGDTITLSGQGSFDPDSPSQPIVAYEWFLKASVGGLSPIGVSSTEFFDWTIPSEIEVGDYTLVLSVIDDDGESSGNLGEYDFSIE